jgi:anti-sigma regulatory factor (Ser/Thr protein kinase)
MSILLKEYKMHELPVEAKTENMDMVLDFVNRHIGHCPAKIQNQIGIVIDEIFSNVSSYAYSPDTGEIVIGVKADESIIILEFRDSGKAYNPLLNDDPDITLSTDEREIGGLGIFMVKNIMDSVEYRRDGGKNILTIKKYL